MVGILKNDEKERDEQLKILATNLEIINQRLSSGYGHSVDLSSTEKLIDSQHNFIVKNMKDMEDRLMKVLDNQTQILSQAKGDPNIVNVLNVIRNELIKEIRENNIFSEVNKGEENIVQEIRKSMSFTLALNKNLPVMFDLLKETIKLLREQNEYLREKVGNN